MKIVSIVLGVVVTLATTTVNAQQPAELPPTHPFLIQNSVYPSIHFDAAQTDTTALPVWKGETRIEPSQVQWLPGVTTIGTVHRPYQDGEQAIFFSGGNRIGKIRVTDQHFEIIDEVALPGHEDDNMSTTEIRRIAKAMESNLNDEKKYLAEYNKFLSQTKQGSATVGNGTYTLMDKDGYYYAGWGTTVYKVGDVRPGDVHSPIEIVKTYDVRDGVPADQRDKLSRIFGFAMTYDGHLAVAMPGIIAVMDRDFKGMQYILLGDEAVDNGISVDDKGGIYCVTSKYMRKVVWDGKTLSDKEADGAWKSEYDYVPNPKALSRGAGNTPALMGFGPGDDKLVVLADAGSKISVIAFWRDEIPADFKQKEGTKSRRIADQLPLKIKVPATIEWSPHIYGNGVMMFASAWPDPVKQEDGKVSVFETVLTAGVTREAPVGAEKWSWNSDTKTFKSDWVANVPVQWTLHPVSAASNTVSLALIEDGVYSLSHLDWDTGKEVGKVILGKNPIFNGAGGFFIPLNESDIYVTGVFGPVRLSKP
ncbi:hypothetical protein CA13_28400 [Planctomycetes bacterium CA13]|uniref:Beta propeller domain protein n=1 Tax=Novipirellula herctigrandis TaxID=2527986 RepID=A0A5C5Z1Y2_9BACT|nr:hypothetical protein CA13_28400 [Planctomycetes bacterium CA13]